MLAIISPFSTKSNSRQMHWRKDEYTSSMSDQYGSGNSTCDCDPSRDRFLNLGDDHEWLKSSEDTDVIEFETREAWVKSVLLELHAPHCPFSSFDTLRQEDFNLNEVQGQTLDFNTLRTSSIACHFCTILFEGVQQVKLGKDGQPDQILVYAYRCNPILSITVWYGDAPFAIEFYTLPGKVEFVKILWSRTDLSTEPATSFRGFRCSKDVPAHLDLDHAVAQIQTWLTPCIEGGHSSCEDNRPLPALPTRVLDVSSFRSPEKLIRVVETTGRRENYMTLSHRWQASMPLVLTKDNREESLRGIKFELLSSTFQHAIQITHALGIKHLWIDSLCIMQGDAEDWEVESAKMATVYSRSYLNLAGTHCTRTSEGLLIDRVEFLDKRGFGFVGDSRPTISIKSSLIKSKKDSRFGNPVYVRPLLDTSH